MMTRSARKKRVVIEVGSDDEPTTGQPAARIVKKEAEPDPAQQVLDLQQKVAKLENDLQGSCRYARQFELKLEESKQRVEVLENILDQKPVLFGAAKKQVDELQKKIDELTLQHSQEVAQLQRVNEQQMRDNERSVASHMNKFNALQHRLHMEKWTANMEQQRDRQRIGELMYRLAQYERGQMQYPVNHQIQYPVDTQLQYPMDQQLQYPVNHQLQYPVDHQLQYPVNHQLQYPVNHQLQYPVDHQLQYPLNHQLQYPVEYKMEQEWPKWTQPPPALNAAPPASLNILEFLPSWDNPQSISFKSAVEQLRARFDTANKDEEWHKRYEEFVRNEFNFCKVCKNRCFEGDQILAHFFSPSHTEQARFAKGAISLAAFKHWMGKLESIPKPAAAK